MRADILSAALVSLLGVASALPIGSRLAKRERVQVIQQPTIVTELAKDTGKNTNGGAPAPPAPPVAGGKPGIAYAPYHNDHRCKSEAEILTDFQLFAKDYSTVRMYGVDCGMVKSGLAAAKKTGLRLFLGIYEWDNEQAQVTSMKDQLGGDWSLVDMVSVGNENMLRGQTPGNIVNRLNSMRGFLRGAGFKGPVVAVETQDHVANKGGESVCEASDICVVNMHAFFNPTLTGDSKVEIRKWFTKGIEDLKKAVYKDKNSKRRVIIAETGWPTAGEPQGSAKPGMEQQKNALDAAREAVDAKDLFLFSPFNEKWKGGPEIEKNFGIGGANSPTN